MFLIVIIVEQKRKIIFKFLNEKQTVGKKRKDIFRWKVSCPIFYFIKLFLKTKMWIFKLLCLNNIIMSTRSTEISTWQVFHLVALLETCSLKQSTRPTDTIEDFSSRNLNKTACSTEPVRKKNKASAISSSLGPHEWFLFLYKPLRLPSITVHFVVFQYAQQPKLILLDCSKLQLGRGRLDDSVSAFRRRLEGFREQTLPMLKALDRDHRLAVVSIFIIK